MAAPRCLPRPTRGPDFYSRPGHFIPRTTKKNQNLRYFRDCDWPRATAPVFFVLKSKRHTNASGFKKKLRSGLTLFCVTGDVLTSFRTPYFIQVKSTSDSIFDLFCLCFSTKNEPSHRPLSLPSLLLLPSPSSLSPTPFLPSLPARPPSVRPPVLSSVRPSFRPPVRPSSVRSSFSRPSPVLKP